MDEKRNDLFEEMTENAEEQASENTACEAADTEDEDINIYESKYTVGDHSWYSDDFENTVKNAVPKDRAISIYKPKEKKFRKFIKNPAVAAVISSLVTCGICLTIFAVSFSSANTLKGGGKILPSAPSETKVMANAIGGQQATGIPEVYDKASPSVVSILCKSAGNGYMQSSEYMSSGSGIIVREDGYIVTNNHVVEGATAVTVTTIAGQTMDAEIVGCDAKTDLAVLKVKPDEALPYAELGDSSSVRVGELAIAIGNPLREELAGTLTVGYISAINRTMVINGKQMTMIQTDAAINPGNSGGALLNASGQVIGINTAKSTGYDVEGLGFAIPINEAKPIVESIIANGYVTGRPIIGITGRTVTEAAAKANDLPIGVYVAQVTEYGAAERGGIQVGDVIVACEGETVETIDEINDIRDKHKPGDTIKFTVVRNGNKINLNIVLQEEKPSEAAPATEAPQQDGGGIQEYPFPSDFFSWFGW